MLMAAIMSAKAVGNKVIPLIWGCDDWNRGVLGGIMVNR